MPRAPQMRIKLGIAISLGIAGTLALLTAGCGGRGTPIVTPTPIPQSPAVTLSAADVDAIVQGALTSVSPTTMVVAVVDRAGNPLALWRKPGAPVNATGNFGIPIDTNDLALGLARTGAFFSNNQAPLTSRTVRFISGIHLPPGVMNQPNADLYGIENTNRGCKLSAELEKSGLLPSTAFNGGMGSGGIGSGIITGKADKNDSDPNAVNPGGLPIFKGTVLVGGIGVAGGAT